MGSISRCQMIKLHGYGGPTEYWDYNLESFTLMAGAGGGDPTHQAVRFRGRADAAAGDGGAHGG